MERTPDSWSCARSRSPGCTGGQSVQSSRGPKPSRRFADWDDGASGSQAAGSSGRRRHVPGGRTIAHGRSWRIERRPAGERPERSTRHPFAEWIVAIRARSTTTTTIATAWSSLPGPLARCCSVCAGTAQPISKRPSRSFDPSVRAVGCFSSPTKALMTTYSAVLPWCLARPAVLWVESPHPRGLCREATSSSASARGK